VRRCDNHFVGGSAAWEECHVAAHEDYPGYSVAAKVGGKTMVHGRRVATKTEATILQMKVSSKGEVDAARWTEIEVAPFIMFQAA
jgi:hypothetical protein